jgi:hypothetical protein
MDKPLHVQVAEALGCNLSWDRDLDWHCRCKQMRDGNRPHCRIEDDGLMRYDTDWSATGPLIEHFAISLERRFDYADDIHYWKASTESGDAFIDSDSPLFAVCFLILELHKQAKLPTTV